MARPQEPTRSASLGYETPRRTDDVLITTDGGELRVELGPISNSVFITQIAAWTLLALVTIASLMYVGREWYGPGMKAWIVAPPGLAAAVLMMFTLARHRHVPPTFVVRQGTLLYSNASTGGRLVAVPRDWTRRIIVRRCWWRPWMCQLDADPAVKFLSAKRGAQTAPRTMTFDTDRPKLQRVAVELRRALGID